MKRRTVLAGAGTILPMFSTGCLETDFVGRGNGPSELPVERPPHRPEYNELLIRGDRKANPVVDFDEADLDDTPAFVEPSKRTITPGETLTLTINNTSSESLQINPFGWQLFKWTSDDWYPISPLQDRYLPAQGIDPNDTVAWNLRTKHNAPVRDGESASFKYDRESRYREWTIKGLGEGVYAFAIRSRFEESTPDDNTQILQTYLHISSEELPVTPTGHLNNVEYENGTVRAESTLVTDGNPVTLVVEPVPSEHLQNPMLLAREAALQIGAWLPRIGRDAIALFEEYEAEIRLLGNLESSTVFPVDEAVDFRFEGEGLRITAESRE